MEQERSLFTLQAGDQTDLESPIPSEWKKKIISLEKSRKASMDNNLSPLMVFKTLESKDINETPRSP